MNSDKERELAEYEKKYLNRLKASKKQKTKQKTKDAPYQSTGNPFEDLAEEIKKDNPPKEEPEPTPESEPHRGIYDNVPSPLKPKTWSNVNSEEKRILESENPYKILGLGEGSDFEKVKKQRILLSVKYNANRGAINRSKKEQEKITEIQSKINKAFDEIKEAQK
jgi:hypothetical protein